MNKSLTREISSAARGGLFAINGILPDPDSILMRHSGGMNVYRELLNDPHVRSCVTSRKSGVLSKGWHIEQHDSSNAAFALVKSVFDSIDADALISQILNAPSSAISPWKLYGRSITPRLSPTELNPSLRNGLPSPKKENSASSPLQTSSTASLSPI